MAFAGAAEDAPGSAEAPGAGLLGTGADIAVDLPPQPQAKKMTIDEKKNTTVFETKINLQERCNASIPEQQLWLNENRLLGLMSYFVGRKG
ncbi:MAG: hypothetical protein WA672_00175 [Candidatus Angelobacter sp.]